MASAVLVVGAYFFARGAVAPSDAQASEQTALLKAIATKDSDNDGLPDWEEALYGTDPHNPDSRGFGMTDGAAVSKGLIVPEAIVNIPATATSSSDTLASIDPSLPPPPAAGTVTAAFAQNFFSLYLAAKQANGGADLSESDISTISNQALSSLSSALTATPDFKAASDLTVSGSGADALKAFAVSAEAVLLANTSDATTSEINYLKAALVNNDETAYARLHSLAKAYRGSAAGLAVLSVPRELAVDDLQLINAMARLSSIIEDFARADTDPLATILALQQYMPVAQALGASFIDIGKVYAAAGVALPAGAPGASLVNLIADIEASQSVPGGQTP